MESYEKATLIRETLEKINTVGIYEELPSNDELPLGSVVIVPYYGINKNSKTFLGYEFYINEEEMTNPKMLTTRKTWTRLFCQENIDVIKKIRAKYKKGDKENITIKETEKLLKDLKKLEHTISNDYYFNFLDFKQSYSITQAIETIELIIKDAKEGDK